MTKTGKIYSILKKIMKVAAISVLSVLALLTVLSVTIPVIWPDFIFAVLDNKDTIRTLGDGKFAIGKYPHGLALEDHRFGEGEINILVNTIISYEVKKESIYVIGDYRGALGMTTGI